MEKGSDGVASTDPLGEYCSWLEKKSDDSDDASSASSRFSSCEGSELERYCSANSVLGTASVCSSSGNRGDFLESYRSFGPGEDCLVEESSLRDRIWRNPWQRGNTRVDRFDGSSDGEVDFVTEGSEGLATKIAGSSSLLSSIRNDGDDPTPRSQVEGMESRHLSSPSHGNLIDSSCSDGEDDTPARIWNGNFHHARKSEHQNESPLLLNSSVAFGGDDWDEFERETEVRDLDSLSQSRNVDEMQDYPPVQYLDPGSASEPRIRTEESVVPSDHAMKIDCNLEKTHHYKPIESISSVDEDELRAQNSHDSTEITVEDLFQVEKINSSEMYDEIVLEMGEILLDSSETPGSMVPHGDQGPNSKKTFHLIDRSSSASTSGTVDNHHHIISLIDGVEVIGTKQKKGDVSFGERLVGVKEYTVYILRVKCGEDQWEVERRYRDFLSLYHRLKNLFIDHGLTLPSPWTDAIRESRNLFGNSSPSVISQRSILIQDCLNSVLQFRFSSGHPSPLIWFLSPPDQISQLIVGDDVSKLGKTISLVLEVKVRKSMGQLLEGQRYMCAGCHRRLESQHGLALKLGWEKNRFCEYIGQLFCSTCHTGDTAILPARVLHHWDFSFYPVSQLAKAFLDSIYEQPMLCVSAVNPFLFSKVPALQQVMGVRKRIASMLPCILCPFRRSILRTLGPRRYLLEDNDFFALRDLVDLSKGAFSGLPTLVETVEKKILNHITQQCLICYDSGSQCAARQACVDPSTLIFPFQESEAARCSSCRLLFHQPCVTKMGSCQCGKLTPVNGQLSSSSSVDFELKGFVDSPAESSDAKALSGFFADVMSKARLEKLWKTRKTQPVILMGSLTGTEG